MSNEIKFPIINSFIHPWQERLGGSVVVYRFARTNTKDPTMFNSYKQRFVNNEYNGYSLCVPVHQDTTA